MAVLFQIIYSNHVLFHNLKKKSQKYAIYIGDIKRYGIQINRLSYTHFLPKFCLIFFFITVYNSRFGFLQACELFTLNLTPHC